MLSVNLLGNFRCSFKNRNPPYLESATISGVTIIRSIRTMLTLLIGDRAIRRIRCERPHRANDKQRRPSSVSLAPASLQMHLITTRRVLPRSRSPVHNSVTVNFGLYSFCILFSLFLQARWPMLPERLFAGGLGLRKSYLGQRDSYGIIIVALFAGFVLNLLKIDPVKALFWSVVINGIIAVPVTFVMMLLSSNPRVMGRFVLPAGLKVLGWLATLFMGLATAGLLLI